MSKSQAALPKYYLFKPFVDPKQLPLLDNLAATANLGTNDNLECYLVVDDESDKLLVQDALRVESKNHLSLIGRSGFKIIHVNQMINLVTDDEELRKGLKAIYQSVVNFNHHKISSKTSSDYFSILPHSSRADFIRTLAIHGFSNIPAGSVNIYQALDVVSGENKLPINPSDLVKESDYAVLGKANYKSAQKHSAFVSYDKSPDEFDAFADVDIRPSLDVIAFSSSSMLPSFLGDVLYTLSNGLDLITADAKRSYAQKGAKFFDAKKLETYRGSFASNAFDSPLRLNNPETSLAQFSIIRPEDIGVIGRMLPSQNGKISFAPNLKGENLRTPYLQDEINDQCPNPPFVQPYQYQEVSRITPNYLQYAMASAALVKTGLSIVSNAALYSVAAKEESPGSSILPIAAFSLAAGLAAFYWMRNGNKKDVENIEVAAPDTKKSAPAKVKKPKEPYVKPLTLALKKEQAEKELIEKQRKQCLAAAATARELKEEEQRFLDAEYEKHAQPIREEAERKLKEIEAQAAIELQAGKQENAEAEARRAAEFQEEAQAKDAQKQRFLVHVPSQTGAIGPGYAEPDVYYEEYKEAENQTAAEKKELALQAENRAEFFQRNALRNVFISAARNFASNPQASEQEHKVALVFIPEQVASISESQPTPIIYFERSREISSSPSTSAQSPSAASINRQSATNQFQHN